jgi:hypothetical protein
VNLYLDTEFNEFGGDLISLALVSPFGDEWYEALPVRYKLTDWVEENVLPKLGKPTISRSEFILSLHEFLQQFPGATIIADWPEDIAHMARLLCGPNGWQLDYWPAFKLVKSGKLDSAVPHNALEDALALMRWHTKS